MDYNSPHFHVNSVIGRRLRMARINLGLTLVDTAERTSISADQLERFESDDDLITAVELMILAKTFCLPVEFFIHDDRLLDCTGEWQLLHAFRQLSASQQVCIQKLIAEIAADRPLSLRSEAWQ
ncbi:MAG: hypothetical protein Fues2KO_04340 [Fuerstiella sp.]